MHEYFKWRTGEIPNEKIEYGYERETFKEKRNLLNSSTKQRHKDQLYRVEW